MTFLTLASLAFVSYNIGLSALCLIIGPGAANFVETLGTFVPFGGTITSSLLFMALSTVNDQYIDWYQTLINSAVVAFAVFEMT